MTDVAVSVPSTGTAPMRSRSRSISAVTYYEQYVLEQKERIVSVVPCYSTVRIPARASAAQTLLAINNPSGSGVTIALRELIVTYDTIVAKAVLSPYLRLKRVTTVAGGTTLGFSNVGEPNRTKMASGLPATAAFMDASVDGTNSGTALSATAVSGNSLCARFLGRMQTLAGVTPAAGGRIDLLLGVPDDEPIEIAANEAVAVTIEAAAALVAGDFHFMIDGSYEEFTRP